MLDAGDVVRDVTGHLGMGAQVGPLPFGLGRRRPKHWLQGASQLAYRQLESLYRFHLALQHLPHVGRCAGAKLVNQAAGVPLLTDGLRLLDFLGAE